MQDTMEDSSPGNLLPHFSETRSESISIAPKKCRQVMFIKPNAFSSFSNFCELFVFDFCIYIHDALYTFLKCAGVRDGGGV